MKRLFLLLLFITHAQAKECQLMEVVGKIRTGTDRLVLTLAEGTQSEKKLIVPLSIQSKFAPYINHSIKTTVVLDGLELKDVKEIERTVANPLEANASNTFKQKGVVPCP